MPMMTTRKTGRALLRLTIAFFVVTITAAILGFGGVADGTIKLAEVLFWTCALLFSIAYVRDALRPEAAR